MRFQLMTAFVLALTLPITLEGADKKPAKRKGGKQKMTLTLTSSAFKHNSYIPKKYTCEGEDVSPGLSWTGLPQNTKSLAIIMDDPDAPPGTWVHWVIYNLPATTASLEEGVLKKENLPNGARQGLCWGIADSDFNRVGYYGPCPPPGKPHRYFFKIYALDTMLGLPAKATKTKLIEAMEGRILGQAELIGLYKR